MEKARALRRASPLGRRGARGAVAIVLVMAWGCDRRLEPWVPLQDEPPAVEGPVRIPGLENPAPRARVVAPPVGGDGIRGIVRLGEGVRAVSGGALFVIARSSEGGPPLAVRRLPPGPFPMPFELGPQDAMMPGRPLTGPIQLSARLDSDQDPMTRADGDLTAESGQPVAAGSTGIELVLERR